MAVASPLGSAAAAERGEAIGGLPTDHEELRRRIYAVQTQVIERDTTIHELHCRAHVAQEDEQRKQELKKGFSVIEKRHVNTSDTTHVLHDSMHHLLYTVGDVLGGCAGALILDVPYNSNLGSTNTDLRAHKLLAAYWEDRPILGADVLAELEDLRHYSDVVTQKKGRVFSAWQIEGLKEVSAELECVESLMAAPVVVDSGTIAVVVVANGQCTERDPRLLMEVLAELWTSNVQPLVNLALDNVRKKETETKLVQESMLRDEIILTLDTILDDVVKNALANTPPGRSTSEHLWRTILQRVANFFEEYFACDTIVAVTNTEANFRIQNMAAISGAGSNTASSARRFDMNGDLEFIHYIFSESMRHVRRTKMRNLSHPSLREAKLMREVMARGEPFYSPNCKGIKLPCGHMKMNCLLLVPILFCEEPVGMLGLANGDFSMSSGRILQSVFTTFWSMIVKATIMSESQKVLNAALPVAISERVKRGETVADSYPSATILFADIVGFTEFTRELDPSEIVEFCNIIFARFDNRVKELGLEKIKVIGDCYMVAGGLQDKSGKVPVVTDRKSYSQMREVVEFGLRILEDTRVINGNAGGVRCSAKLQAKLKKTPLQFRIGISEGPVTAGVFGTARVQYDVLGATVNLASRLQSSGRPNSVQVSASIYEELQGDGFEFEKRKPICLKGLGLQQTYFLKEPERSEKGSTADSLEETTAAVPPEVAARSRSQSSAQDMNIAPPARVERTTMLTGSPRAAQTPKGAESPSNLTASPGAKAP